MTNTMSSVIIFQLERNRMFKYISDILKSITPKQRLIALSITLLFILLITVGNNIINAISNSDSILDNKVKRLEIINAELNQQIIQSQLQCTKDITVLRKQIIDEITQLENEMKQYKYTTNSLVIIDTVNTQTPRVIYMKPDISRLSNMKNNLMKEESK